jgi:general secretion pathway protein F
VPEYEYRAIGRNGIEIAGHEQADSVEALTIALRKQQLTLLRAKTQKTSDISQSVVLPFVSELSPLINSGIPLDRALQIITEDSRDAKVSDLAGQLRKSIKRGESLSGALAQLGRFDPMLVALVQVGEASGKLQEVLGILERYYQDARKIRGDLVASLTYPAILALVALLSMIGLSLFVVPVFKDIFADDTTHVLPLGTRILFAISDFMIAYGWIAAFILAVIVTGVVMTVLRNDAANRKWHAMQLSLPLWGELQAKFAAFKLAKALSIMLTGGLPLPRSLEIARPLLTNRLQREGLEDCLSGLRKGEPIPQAINRIPAMPVQFSRYIKLGNETGALGSNLSKVADILQEDFKNRLQSMATILNPLIIVSMGGIVGFMVISILLAVFSLSDVH